MLTNTPKAVNTVNASQIPRLNTDHHLVSILLSTHARISSAASKTRYTIDYSKLDYLRLVDYLFNYDFAGIMSCLDVEDIWNQLSSIIKEAIQQCAPTVKLRARKNYPMWYNSNEHLINRVRSARKKARLIGTPNNINKLERADQELSSHMHVCH